MEAKRSVQDELETIRRRHRGLLRPVDVVDYARDENTLLHEMFEWDDGDAARKYRLEQARKLLRVHVTILEGSTKEIRAYVSLPSDREKPGGGYRHIKFVMSNEQQRLELLATALNEMEHFRYKYQALQELVPVFEAMDKINGDLRKKKVQTAARSRKSIPLAAAQA